MTVYSNDLKVSSSSHIQWNHPREGRSVTLGSQGFSLALQNQNPQGGPGNQHREHAFHLSVMLTSVENHWPTRKVFSGYATYIGP